MSKFLDALARLINWPFEMWRSMERGMDRELLWPICCAGARKVPEDMRIEVGLDGVRRVPDLELARSVFAMHAAMDPAWRALGADRMVAAIDAMPWVEPR